MADLTAGQIPLVANTLNGGVADLTGTTIGSLGSNTNGLAVYTAGSGGGRIYSLTACTTDTVTINVFVYIFRGSTVIPLGLVNVPLSSGNTLAAKLNVDFLDGINILGLPIDNSGKRYIALKGSDVLKVSTLANLSAATHCYVQAMGADY